MLFSSGGKRPFLALTACVLGGWEASAPAQTITYANEHPEIQKFSYPAASANGAGSVRDRAPTFGSFSGFDQETQQAVFFPGTGSNPSRRGSFIIAANTSTDVPVDLDPSRYQIESLRITATVIGSLVFPPFSTLQYDNTIDDSVALTTGGGDDPGQPVELYGIGLQGDYETIGFGSAEPGALNLTDVRYRPYRVGEEGYDPEQPNRIAPYQYFALGAAGRDAENAVVGGYSATEPDNTTEQFTPEPFAIGKLYDEQGVEYAPGSDFQNNDVFVFEPNLEDPRILDYLQRSLAEGHLGFSFSSLHQPAGHTGSAPYPDFYLDDLDSGNNPDGAAPTIEFVVTLLDELLPGDYDANGRVDHNDYTLWASQAGSAGPDADGNGDGVVNTADYAIWRANYSADSVAAIAVPEPTGLQTLAMVGLTIAFCGGVSWFTRPSRSREAQDE